MNFYFNYFLFVGREGIFNCQRQRQHSCVLSSPEKVDTSSSLGEKETKTCCGVLHIPNKCCIFV